VYHFVYGASAFDVDLRAMEVVDSNDCERWLVLARHGCSLPNVKDEPRPWLARRVPREDWESVVSFRDS